MPNLAPRQPALTAEFIQAWHDNAEPAPAPVPVTGRRYRVCFQHKGGFLMTHYVSAPSKKVAESKVRAEFSQVFAHLSSVTPSPLVRTLP